MGHIELFSKQNVFFCFFFFLFVCLFVCLFVVLLFFFDKMIYFLLVVRYYSILMEEHLSGYASVSASKLCTHILDRFPYV